MAMWDKIVNFLKFISNSNIRTTTWICKKKFQTLNLKLEQVYITCSIEWYISPVKTTPLAVLHVVDVFFFHKTFLLTFRCPMPRARKPRTPAWPLTWYWRGTSGRSWGRATEWSRRFSAPPSLRRRTRPSAPCSRACWDCLVWRQKQSGGVMCR